MENIKKFLGSDFKDDLTTEQVIEMLNTKLGSGDYKNIATGDYVNVDKYNKAVAKHKEDSEKAKLYDELKPKYDDYVTKAHEASLNEKIVNAKVKKEFVNFVRHELGQVEDFDTALSDYVKNNPQYLEQKKVVISSSARLDENEQSAKKNDNKSINEQIRSIAGFYND